MKRTIIIVIIAILAMLAIGLGLLIALTPEAPEPAPIDIHTDNTLISDLGIQRPETRIERLLAIRTYQGGLDASDMIKLAENGGMEYLELDDNGSDYLLVVPFETNGQLKISKLAYNTYEERYEPSEVVYKAYGGEKLYDKYSLLIRYSRPSIPEYEIKLIQNDGDQTATYQIVNMEDKAPVKTTQFIKDDSDAGTESVGVAIKINKEE